MRKVGLIAALLLCLPGMSEAQSSISYRGAIPPDVSNAARPVYWTDFLKANVDEGFTGNNLTSSAAIASEANRPGICRIIPNAVSVVGTLYLTSAINPLVGALDYLRFDVRPYSDANIPTHRMGALVGPTAAPADGMYFEHKSGDTNWYAVTRASSTETRTDTGVAFAAGAFAAFEISFSATEIRFWINGVAVATNTTNISVSVSAFVPCVQVTTTGTVINTDFDFFKIRLTTTRVPGIT